MKQTAAGILKKNYVELEKIKKDIEFNIVCICS